MMGPSSSSQTGTQMYMAPELFAGKPASIRSDIYSLGVVLYQLLMADFSRPVATDWANDVSDPLLRDDLQHCFAGRPQDRFAGVAQLGKNLCSLSRRRAALATEKVAQIARERAAYRRGMIRTASLAGAVIVFIALLALIALKQTLLAKQTANDLRLNLYCADMKLAQISLQESNLGRAVALVNKWFPKPGE